MSVGEVCNREVVILEKGGSIQEAIELMREYHVGDVVIVDEQHGRRIPVGILTDRDVVVEILAENVDLESVAVGDVMSYELVAARENDGIDDALKRMRAKGIRRMPVVDEQGVLVGILTVDDLIDYLAEQMRDLAGLIMREQSKEKERRK